MDPIDSIKQGTTPDLSPNVVGEGAPTAPSGLLGNITNQFTERFKLLLQPDPRIPEQFVGKKVAVVVNDKLGPESEEAQLGESVALCWDVLTSGSLTDVPPAVHLGWSGFKFLKLRRDKNTPPPKDSRQAAHQPTR